MSLKDFLSQGPSEDKITFKSGLLQANEGGTVTALPDKGRAIFKRTQQGEDTLVQFIWQKRKLVNKVEQEATESDIVHNLTLLYENEWELSTVPQQQRVLLLSSKSADKKIFLWFQEPKTDLDIQICDVANQIITLPKEIPLQGQDDDEDDSDSDYDQMEGVELSQQGHEQHLQSQDITQQIASTGQQQTSNPQSNQLYDMLLNHLRNQQNQNLQRQHQYTGPFLKDILSPELILPIILKPENQEAFLEELKEHLPPTQQDKNYLIQLFHSPQFQSQIRSLDSAILQGQIDSSAFGLGQQQGLTTLDFLKAIQEKADQDRQTESKEEDTK